MSTTRAPCLGSARPHTVRAQALALAIVFCLVAAAPGRVEPEHPRSEHGEAARGGERHGKGEAHRRAIVRLPAGVLDEFGIRVAVAGPGRIGRTVTLPAEVRANEDRLAHITPRFPGIVKSVRKRIGDRVEAGELLATIESSESLASYPLTTGIAGVVIARHVTRGEAVTRETLAFVIADLHDVWIDISAHQNNLDQVRVGQRVLISAGHGREEAEGTISYVSPVVDEATRTATARVVLSNPDHVWRPGMFVTARVLVEDAEVPVVVPRTAVEIVGGERVVFVETDAGFAPRPIVGGRQDSRSIEVVAGLRPGERYVARGGFTLKAELAREELSGDPGH